MWARCGRDVGELLRRAPRRLAGAAAAATSRLYLAYISQARQQLLRIGKDDATKAHPNPDPNPNANANPNPNPYPNPTPNPDPDPDPNPNPNQASARFRSELAKAEAQV